jgi:GNAT superfamily N-acetyltransferase
MPLTVLKTIPASSPADLIRLFHQSQLEWSRHLGEEIELDFGRWISNPILPTVDDANCLLDAFIVPGMTAAEVISQMDDRSQQHWRCCTLNPSMTPDRTGELVAALLAQGWTMQTTDILYRTRAIARALPAINDLTLIPARASFRHYRQLMQQRALTDAGAEPDAAMLHLDDSHLDALLALQAGNPVGCISVLTTGEVGTVREWYVTPEHRNHGLGRLLLDRAMEICSRSVLRHVMIALPPSAQAAHRLCQTAGFQVIGQTSTLHRPFSSSRLH